jgi:hypothetical protein
VMDPRTVVHGGPGADLAITARVPGVRRFLGKDTTGGTGEQTLWLLETYPDACTDGSWVIAEYVLGNDRHQVTQYGPRRLWDEVTDAYTWWLRGEHPAGTGTGSPSHPTGRSSSLTSPISRSGRRRPIEPRARLETPITAGLSLRADGHRAGQERAAADAATGTRPRISAGASRPAGSTQPRSPPPRRLGAVAGRTSEVTGPTLPRAWPKRCSTAIRGPRWRFGTSPASPST